MPTTIIAAAPAAAVLAAIRDEKRARLVAAETSVKAEVNEEEAENSFLAFPIAFTQRI